MMEAYCRNSCDLRNSGGLWEGGWVGGYRRISTSACALWSMDGTGLIAEATAAVAYRRCLVRAPGHARRHRIGKRSRGGI